MVSLPAGMSTNFIPVELVNVSPCTGGLLGMATRPTHDVKKNTIDEINSIENIPLIIFRSSSV
jgi:hypothetical protein